MSQQENDDLSLAKRALRLKYGVWKLMSSPKAALLPAEVREMIKEMAALMADMAQVLIVSGWRGESDNGTGGTGKPV